MPTNSPAPGLQGKQEALVSKLALPFLPPPVNDLTRLHYHQRNKRKVEFFADLAALTASLPLYQVRDDAWVHVIVADGRADADSRIKALLDGLEHIGVFWDDRQVMELRVNKVPRGTMDARMLVMWGDMGSFDTARIEAFWGAPVKAPKRTRKESRA